MKSLIGKDFAVGTYGRYCNALNHIQNYIKYQYKVSDIPLDTVDYKFITGFDLYLKTVANCQHNTSMKNIIALKKIIRIALANGYIKNYPFFNYKITRKGVDKQCLTIDEMITIMNRQFTIKRLELIRDLFLVQAFTGLAYKDLATLKHEHIQTINERKWLLIKRNKTNVPCYIPLLPIVERIIEKYKDSEKCKTKETLFLLPVPSNQRFNSYLKEIADLCGINKPLQTHLGRYFYINKVINGMPLDSARYLVGHTKLSSFLGYSKLNIEKIQNDFNVVIPQMAL